MDISELFSLAKGCGVSQWFQIWKLASWIMRLVISTKPINKFWNFTVAGFASGPPPQMKMSWRIIQFTKKVLVRKKWAFWKTPRHATTFQVKHSEYLSLAYLLQSTEWVVVLQLWGTLGGTSRGYFRPQKSVLSKIAIFCCFWAKIGRGSLTREWLVEMNFFLKNKVAGKINFSPGAKISWRLVKKRPRYKKKNNNGP